MVTTTPFKEVVARLDTLTEKLKRATDEDERRRLLKEFRTLLGKADAKTSEC
jgi:predicted  nucleic acid-binding Zn-ribbon protein